MPYNIIQTDSLIYEVTEIHEHENDLCGKICDNLNCFYRKCIDPLNNDNIRNTRIQLIISNITPNPLQITSSNFTLVDSNDFSHKGMEFCFKYAALSYSYSGTTEISPYTRVRYEVIFRTLDANSFSTKLLINNNDNYYTIFLKDVVVAGRSERLNSKIIEELSKKISSLTEENIKLKKALGFKDKVAPTDETTNESKITKDDKQIVLCPNCGKIFKSTR